MFGFFKRRRRKKIIALPFPPEWEAIIEQNLTHWQYLTDVEKQTLRDCIKIFITEKQFHGCEGQQVNDEIRVTIAAGACLLLIGFDHDYYRNVQSILVYPSAFTTPNQSADTITLGQAHYRGPVILAWDSARHGVSNAKDGRNLIYHEFAHKLDMLDGVLDGTPPIKGHLLFDDWVKVMTKEYEQLCDKKKRSRATLLDKYGATNPAEFFAVTTECFFEKPDKLNKKHPDLYRIMQQFYQQDPASRM